MKVLTMTHILARGRERDCVYRGEESRLGEAECVDGAR